MQRIYPVARVLEFSSCLLPFYVIMFTQDVREEALLNIRCIVWGYHLCHFDVNAGEVLTANKKRIRGENAKTSLKLLTIVVSSATYGPSLACGSLFGQIVESINIKCVYNYCIQRCDFLCWFRQSATKRYQLISIYLSIVIDNRYQSITTQVFTIDWSSIININQLIDIDWYWLISIVINYRFHRLDTLGQWNTFKFLLHCHDFLCFNVMNY